MLYGKFSMNLSIMVVFSELLFYSVNVGKAPTLSDLCRIKNVATGLFLAIDKYYELYLTSNSSTNCLF